MKWSYLAILFCLLGWTGAPTVSRASNGGEILTIRLNRTVGYWTDERLREAMSNPIELSVENMNSTRRKRDGHVWTEEEIRSSSPLDTDVSLDTLRAMGIEPNDITMFDVELSPKNVADINEYPFNNYGKLFINSQHGGGHCSAAFVRERVLITAAHCIRRENGDWYEHFRFYQRFNGIEDQGRIVEVEKPFIYSNYINDEGGMELKLDYAFLTTAESDDVTHLGHDFSGEISSEEQIYFAGYPADTEGGSRLIWSSGTRNQNINALIHVPSNPLTQGSSGGAWLTLDLNGVYNVVGLASHGKPAQGFPGTFSPFLNSEAASLLAEAESTIVSDSAEHTVHVDEEDT